MEEFQLVFVWWLVKFIAGCAMFLVLLRWMDRRWRGSKTERKTFQQPPATMALSRRRARS